MKVTAIIDDRIIEEAMKYSNSDSISGALRIALKEYINRQKLKELREKIEINSLSFIASAEELRNLNRES